VVGRNRDGRLGVFAQGNDAAVWHRLQGPRWSRWESLKAPEVGAA
jgi:hypothetical protein